MDAEAKKLFVTRHAESLEDIDNNAYGRIADEDMPLSEKGQEQAKVFGQRFIHEFGTGKHLRLILPPSKRVLETAEIIISGMPAQIKWSLSTERLIAKQNWGNITIHNRAEIEKQRYLAGVLRYQFPGGESGTEMILRFDLFAKKLKQEMASRSDEDTLIITHGFGLRVLLKILLGWTEEYFESLAQPRHCDLKRLVYDKGAFLLLDEMMVYDPSKNPGYIRRQSNE